ncbi:Proton-coupled amino acid transporter 1-like [Oopsacas minuta]|uniref:Proton-coupled amino acid transporter 1-like n=1 Tax=Oopsacas minuta TaxID=111878 RepID=A0AAV7JX02_9METZ|nr:Proton-coupled amino acid transporter 1-like [Oopsacas minuta]
MTGNISQGDDNCSSEEDVPDLHPMLASNGINGYKIDLTDKCNPLPPHTLDLVSEISRKNSQKRQQNSTTGLSTLMNLLRSNLGVGLLSMPNAIQDAGYILGPIGILLMGMLACHCMTILVRCSHALCHHLGVSSLDYADIAELALSYKLGLKRSSILARYVINMFLIITQIGMCCTYFLFISENTARLIVMSGGPYFSTHTMILYFLPLVILLSFIRSLKGLSPFTTVANFCYLFGSVIIITFSIMTIINRGGLGEGATPFSSTGYTYALFFGNVIFAVEGIGVILPIENKIAKPQLFTPLLWLTIIIVTLLFTVVGVSGYIAIGSELKPVITLEFPLHITSPYQVVYPIAILYLVVGTLGSYVIQFYVPMDIIEPVLLKRVSRKYMKLFFQLLFRASVVLFTAVIPILIYNIKFLIDLIGACSGSFLAITIPALLEMIIFSGQRRYGLPFKVWIIKDIFIFTFGFVGAVFGTGLTIFKIVTTET